MDLLLIAKAVSLLLVVAASVYAASVLKGKSRNYLLTIFFLLFLSSAFFIEQDFSSVAVAYDWLKHTFLYLALGVFYFFWIACLKEHCKI